MVNIPLGSKVPMSPFRNFANLSWRKSIDPTVFHPVDFDVTDTIAMLKQYKKENKTSITIFHYFIKILGLSVQEHPRLNTVIIGKNIYQRELISFFIIRTKYLSDTPGSHDLVGKCIKNPHLLDVNQIPFLMNDSNMDSSEQYGKNIFYPVAQRVPLFITRLCLKLIEWLIYTCNFSPKYVGLPKDQFGTMWISNIGPLGLPPACVPPFPFSRCGLGVSIGALTQKGVVKNDRIEIRDILPVIFSIDHRLFNAADTSAPIKLIQDYFDLPGKVLD